MTQIMYGHDQIFKRMQQILTALRFDYHTEPQVQAKIAQALSLAQDCRDIVDPKDSRVGKVSISSKIKMLVVKMTSLNSAVQDQKIKGNRVNTLTTAISADVSEIIKLLITKTSVEAADKKINKIRDTNLRQSLSDSLIEVKDIKLRSNTEQVGSEPYSQLKDVNDALIAEGEAFKQRLTSAVSSRKNHLICKASLAVIADPVIPAAKLARTNINYVVMAGVIIMRSQVVACSFGKSNTSLEEFAETRYALHEQVTRKYKTKFIDVLKEMEVQDFVAVRGISGVRMMWFLPTFVYDALDGFKLKSVGLPWN